MKINKLPFLKVLADITSKHTKIPKKDFKDVGSFAIIDQSSAYISGYTNDKSKVRTNEEPVIIFGDHTRVIKYADFPFAIGADGVKVLNVDREIADPKYIYYFLKSLDIPSAGYSRHFKFLKEKKISLPESLTDQKRIAKVLSNCEQLIQKRKQSINLLDDFLKSTFLELFGDPALNNKKWKVLTGNKFCYQIKVGVVVKPASHYVDEGVIALRSLNIKPNKIVLDDVVYFSEESIKTILSKSTLKEGDVVIVRTGNTGTAAVIPKEYAGYNCIDLIIASPRSELIRGNYLAYLLNSDRGKLLISAREVGGIHKHFNVKALNSLSIPIPPIELQKKFDKVVFKAESIKTQFQQSLQELENLYGSLSQKAFKGELDLSKVEIEEEMKIYKKNPWDLSPEDEADLLDMLENNPDQLMNEPSDEECWEHDKEFLEELILSKFEKRAFTYNDLEKAFDREFSSISYNNLKKFLFQAIESNFLRQIFSTKKDEESIQFELVK